MKMATLIWHLHLSVLVHLVVPGIQCAPLLSYLEASFTSPDPTLPFNHITLYNETGDVYIGATERLYHLSSSLTLKETVVFGPCQSPNEEIINNNQLLVIAPSPFEQLITCGSCDGFCETMSLANISAYIVRHDEYGALQRVTVDTGDVPTVGSVAWGSEFDLHSGEGEIDAILYLFTGVSFMIDHVGAIYIMPMENMD